MLEPLASYMLELGPHRSSRVKMIGAQESEEETPTEEVGTQTFRSYVKKLKLKSRQDILKGQEVKSIINSYGLAPTPINQANDKVFVLRQKNKSLLTDLYRQNNRDKKRITQKTFVNIYKLKN